MNYFFKCDYLQALLHVDPFLFLVCVFCYVPLLSLQLALWLLC